MKKTVLGIFLLVITLILSGCAKVEYGIKINEDDSGEITYIYGLDKAILKDLGKTEETATIEEQKAAEEADYTIEKYEDDNIIGFKATKKVKNITEKSYLLEIFGEEYIESKDESKIKIEKTIFGKKYNQTAILDLSQLKDMKKLGATIKYTITLPAKIDKTNADIVSKDKKTATWNLECGEVEEITFIARTRRNLCMDNNYNICYSCSRSNNFNI